ncbi:putative disease resistance RPP13-like protein 1 [Lactuca sativa]|uniref:putative disease resistance RPP13-like protein 1 n=1 Tax=Lactuca sativa TaxID=4236 RepID=UPI000CB7FF77|nr:putative disease resistance RPP13-like protein 1 [Lactuca sativa]
MAEIVVSAIFTALYEKFISRNLRRVARSEGIDSRLKKWIKTLLMIEAVLADADEKQITNRAVQLWLKCLQDLAYDIDDVLDDLATEAIRRNLNQESYVSIKFIPTCTNFTRRSFMYGRQVSSRLDEIATKLKDLIDAKNDLGLKVNVERSNRRTRRLEQTPLIDEYKIMGRGGDKEALLVKLLGNEACDENVSIVSIVGMVGIGKTTLAKVLYNDYKVQDHFEVRAWVNVSEEFDLFTISKAIFVVLGGEDKSFSNLDMLQVALKDKLLKKRYLLVLDDVWNKSYTDSEILQRPLLVGAPGSRIIVTTYDVGVALIMGSDEPYNLDVLSDEDALSLLAQHALGEKNFDKRPTLKSLGEGFVKKCGGLPLALTMFGKSLRTKVDADEWKMLLNTEMKDVQIGREILASLRSSYYDLPSHLKQLFAYCSLIPKNYVFNKNELVLMWMAHGYLSGSISNKSMEHLGHLYFEELKSMSFIQHSATGELGYTMHTLINDLATTVAEEFFFRLDDEMNMSNTNETFKKLRQFSVSPRCGSYRKLKELQGATRLQTLLLIPSLGGKGYGLLDNLLAELLPKLQFLRVLSAANQEITKVPESIGSLKHLRYLNFSDTAITCLPQQVSHLYNLQTLLLRNCYQLSELPESFSNLINLRHLDISGTPNLNKMPLGIGGLSSLQTLPKVIIEGANGFKISELKGLSNFQSELSISGLDKVTDPKQAKDANLHQKEGLDVLEMKWSNVFDGSRNEMNEYKVLEDLRPHPKLRNLKILFYKGTRFPSWVGDPSFSRLTELTLCGCRSTHLPPLGHLKSLRKLFLTRMNEVKIVGFESLEPANSPLEIAFPSLEVLKFDDMPGWQRWLLICGDNHGTFRPFPCLHEISITRCPKLDVVFVDRIPSLRLLHIEECSGVVLRSMVGVSSSLVSLEMLNLKGLTRLHGEYLKHLGALEDLYIAGCDELIHLGEPVSVHKLEVLNCKKLASLGEKEVKNAISMRPIKEVICLNCDSLESYTCPKTVEKLVIGWCRSMTSLTLHELDSSLKELCINDCPNMDYSFPSGSWPLNLSKLTIGGLKKPMSEWGFQNFPTSLLELHLYGENSEVDSFAVATEARNATATSSSTFILPSSLTSLSLDGFMDVESLSEVLKHLPFLQRLDIWSCPKLRDLPETTSDSSSLTIRVWH